MNTIFNKNFYRNNPSHKELEKVAKYKYQKQYSWEKKSKR